MYVMCMFYLYSCHVVRDHGYRFCLCTCLYVFYVYVFYLYPYHFAWIMGIRFYNCLCCMFVSVYVSMYVEQVSNLHVVFNGQWLCCQQ